MSKNVNKEFPPKFFGQTPINDLLAVGEKRILLMTKDSESAEVYSTFNDDFSLYLNKLPNNLAKKHVQDIYNKGLIYIGVSTSSGDGVFSRVLSTKDGRLAGIVLDASDLGIDVKLGSTDSIDDCIYASYFGIIRGAVILNKTPIKKDKDLHGLGINYLYRIIMKSLAKSLIYSPKQKMFIYAACVYIFYRHFLEERHTYALAVLKRDYKNVVGKEAIEEYVPRLNVTQKYDSVKDLPRLLVDTKVMNVDPGSVTLGILRNLKTNGFYALTGPFDQFMGMVILSRYPNSFFPKWAFISNDVQEAAEKIISKYISKTKTMKAIPGDF